MSVIGIELEKKIKEFEKYFENKLQRNKIKLFVYFLKILLNTQLKLTSFFVDEECKLMFLDLN